MFGKATKKAWRTKAPQNRDQPFHTITKPGHCVSIDQLESSTPGLIGHLRGIPPTKRYEVSTVFIDHHSGLGYVPLQKSTTAIETVEAVDAFERYAVSLGVYVHHYHADNGRFADNLFRQAVRKRVKHYPSVEATHISRMV